MMVTKKNVFTVIAHRGGPVGKFEENSLEAFENVLGSYCSIFETDVWLRDGELVITHELPVEGKKYLSFSRLLKLVDGRKEIYLEIKHEASAVPALEKVRADYSKHFDSVIFASFEKQALQAIREKDKSARISLLYRRIDNEFIDLAEELGAESVGFNWLRVFPNYFNIKQSREVSKLKHLAYTVNGKFLARVMKSLGMNGIFTDYPDRFTD